MQSVSIFLLGKIISMNGLSKCHGDGIFKSPLVIYNLIFKEKRQLWKIWKSGGSKEGYLEAKRVAKKKVYAAKKKAEEVQFANVASDKEDRNQLFKIARQMVKTNADVVGDKCVTNDDGELACTDSEKLSAWKQHYEKLLNKEFRWEKEHLVLKEPC